MKVVANNQIQPEKSHMAHNDIGFLSVAASQFGTAVGQVYAVPRYAVPTDPSCESEASNPFYASRHDVAGKKRPLDLTRSSAWACRLTVNARKRWTSLPVSVGS